MKHLLAQSKVRQEKMDATMRANRQEMRARMDACHHRAGAHQIGLWAEMKTNQEEMQAS